jgi:lipoyl(octanoyl) transferase
MRYEDALREQETLVDQRKQGLIPDQLLFVEHPHVVTMGRNGKGENLLASPELLERAGIAFYKTNRGGDVTYHGPGQVVGYPIVDLREWKRDVVGFVRALEQSIIDALAEFGVCGERLEGHTGVWVSGAKIAAIGVHISRWVTSHGFALNHTTDLSYFKYIVPCGLHLPVTSLDAQGVSVSRGDLMRAFSESFARCFNWQVYQPVLENKQ